MKTLKITLFLALILSFQQLSAQDSYYFSKTLKGSFEVITSDVKSVLKDQGFGVKAVIKDNEDGTVEVVIVNPSALMGMLNNPDLTSIANEVSTKFKTALDNL